MKCAAIPTLKSLRLVSPDPATAEKVLLVSTADWVDVLTAIPTFILNSRCTLKRFSFIMNGSHNPSHPAMTTQPSMSETLTEAFHYMLSLEGLQIIEAVSGPRLLTEDVLRSLSRQALPHLRSMELVWAKDDHPNAAVLKTMISSRLKETRLSSIRVGRRKGQNFQPKVLDFLRDLRKRGMNVKYW